MSQRAERLFGPPDFFGSRFPIWEWKLSRALPTENSDRNLQVEPVCHESLAELTASAKDLLNDWLTVTNWVPPVNDAYGHSRLPKTYQPGVTQDGNGSVRAVEPSVEHFRRNLNTLVSDAGIELYTKLWPFSVFSRSMNSPQEFGAVTEKYCGELLAFEGL